MKGMAITMPQWCAMFRHQPWHGHKCTDLTKSLPGKLLKRIIHNQISNYLEINSLLYVNQHGFRSEKSTTTAVFSTLEKIFENWNMGLTSTCIFIDFSRTLDSIDHEIVLKKLRLYGFNDKSVSFVTSYLESKTQSTIVNGYPMPSDARLQCGTAQGSILGPLFFSLYVNDIFAFVEKNNSLTIYADDTLLIEQGVTKESSIEACQNRLHEVET